MALFQEEDADGYRFTVHPNCALDWRWIKRVIFVFACCLGAVSWYFASRGAWLVLPFAGLELAVLGAGFYLSGLAGHRREVIEIRGNDLRVLRGGSRLQEIAAISRHWTRVSLVRDPRGWYPSRLVLRCQGHSVEILTRLVESERETLAAALDKVLRNDQLRESASSPNNVSRGIAAPVSTEGLSPVFRKAESLAMTRTPFPVDGE